MKNQIYLADPMTYTFFVHGNSGHDTFALNNKLVDDVSKAQVIVARTHDALIPFMNHEQPLVIWTHEPMYNICSEKKFWSYIGRRYIYTLNLYNHDVYFSPFKYFPFRRLNKDRIVSTVAPRNKCIASLGRYGLKGERYVRGINVDLAQLRERTSLELYNNKLCDIFGQGWPSFVKIVEDSRGLGWRNKKTEILVNYKFNFCLENTHWQHYVTEKIWDAILAGCVPVYYSLDNGLRGVLTDGVVVELEKISQGSDLIALLQSMTDEERIERVSTLVDDWNRIHTTVDQKHTRDAAVHQFNSRVQAILNSPVSERSGRNISETVKA